MVMRRFRVAASVVLVVLCACSVSTDPTPNNIAGTFELTTVDSAPLPVVESETATQVKTLLNASVTLNSNLSFMQVLNYRVTSKADGSVQSSQTTRNGTFVMQGKTVTFLIPTFNGDSPPTGWSGTVSGNVLIFSDPFSGKLAVYQRE